MLNKKDGSLITQYDDSQSNTMQEKYDLSTERNTVLRKYFPIMNLENIGDLEAINMNIEMLGKYIRTGVPQSFSKERVPVSEKSFSRYSFFENIYRYTKQTEYYKAFAESVRDSSKYLRHPVIKTSIEKQYGKPLYNTLTNWLDDVARGRDKYSTGFLDDISTLLRTNYVVSVLGGNISTVVKQPISFIQGAGMIEDKWATYGLFKFMMNPLKSIATVNSKSVQMKNRAYNQERELQEITRGRGLPKIFKQKLSLNDLKRVKQAIREGSMAPILLADKMTVTAIWLGAYEKSMQETLGNEQASIDYADKVIRRTQPQSGVIHLPEIFKSTPFVKMFTTFRNQPNQNWNLLYDTFVKYRKETKSLESFKEFVGKTWHYLILGGLTYGAIVRRRLPKDKEELAMDMAQASTSGLIVLGDIVQKIRYPYGSGSLLDSVLSEGSKIVTSKKPETKIQYLGKTIGKTLGVPGYTAVERFFTRDSLTERLLGGENTKKKSKSRRKLSF
jgi:hypothetical protein